jgi:hypothetical protein
VRRGKRYNETHGECLSDESDNELLKKESLKIFGVLLLISLERYEVLTGAGKVLFAFFRCFHI